MISTLEEATQHAKQAIHKADYVSVLPDGHILLSRTPDELIEILDKNEIVFVVKGEVLRSEKKSTKKIKEAE